MGEGRGAPAPARYLFRYEVSRRRTLGGMDRDVALARLSEITEGIDMDELGGRCVDPATKTFEDDDNRGGPRGWWETSTGAVFGAERLAELRQLITALTAEPDGRRQ